MMAWSARHLPSIAADGEGIHRRSTDWYVIGQDRGRDPDEAFVVFRIEQANDHTGADTRPEIAQQIATILNAVPGIDA